MKKEYKPYDINIDSLGFFVDRLLFAMVKSRNKDLRDENWDIQHAEFITLKVINALGAASQSQIAKVMGKERSGMSRIIASLEKKGYIERTHLNGSTNHVTLSEKGKNIMPAVVELSDRLTERTFKGFSTKSRIAIMKNLDRLYRNVLIED